MRTHFQGEKIAGSYTAGAREWVAMITWRLGHHGPSLLTAATEDALAARLKKLDPSVTRGRRMFEGE